MKQIIDGLRYDTNKADLVGEWGNNLSRTNFDYCFESLYKTQSGRYFLAGEGGAKSKYGVKVDNNSWSEGSRITPLSKAEALQWAESNLSSEAIEEYFNDSIKDA